MPKTAIFSIPPERHGKDFLLLKKINEHFVLINQIIRLFSVHTCTLNQYKNFYVPIDFSRSNFPLRKKRKKYYQELIRE